MIKVVLTSVICVAVAATDASLADKLISMPPGHDDFPETFSLWGKLNSTFEEIVNMIDTEDVDLFGFCSSQPDVRMGDGTKIFTSVVIPPKCDKKRPAMLVRSPYGPTTRRLALLYVFFGYVAVMQDQRGTFSSEGTFDMWQLGNPDGVDTMAWITNQTWSNGEVFTMGASADGIATLTPIMTAGIPVKGQWSIWTTGDGHGLSYTGGAFRKDLLDGYMNTMGLFTHGASRKVVGYVKEHEAYGPWWYNLTDCRNVTDRSVVPACNFPKVHWPVVLSAGWWDIFLISSLKLMNGVLAAGDPAYLEKHVTIIDPLGHCMLTPFHGEGIVESATLELQAARGLVVGFFASLQAFRKQAMDMNMGHKRLNFFVLGNYEADTRSPRNYWTSMHYWPAYINKDFYMHGSAGKTGKLSETAPSATTSMTYTYDPRTKDGLTPIEGGNNLPFIGKIHACGTADQTKRDAREDVLAFDSDKLSEDTAVVGNITAKIFVSSDAVDTDFVVVLSDVGPRKAMMVRFGALRMRWRDGDERTAPPLEAGKIYEASIHLSVAAYIFPKGHRIRVTISSAAYPYFDANTNTGSLEISPTAAVAANNGFHMGPNSPSKVTLPIVKMEDIPHNRLFGASIPDPIGLAKVIRDAVVV
jgi:hypothetical protein